MVAQASDAPENTKMDRRRRVAHGLEQAVVSTAVPMVAHFDNRTVEKLLKNAGIVRHRGKVDSAINNAQRTQELRAEFGSLAAFVWKFEPPCESRPRALDRAALVKLAVTPKSTALSKGLKCRGWSFVGPTTMYAFMQSAGIVNDHLPECTAWHSCSTARADFTVPTPA